MKSLKHNGITLASIGAALALSATAVSLEGCDDAAENLCGPCGSFASGNLSVSGNGQLDGFLQATATLGDASAQIRGQFEAELQALADIYGVANFTADGAGVASLVAAIRADINANVDGGISLKYTPPQCSANVEVAVSAQAECEASAECDVDVDPGMAEVTCEGKCEGSCSGGCSGEISCTPPSGSVGCDVGCEGTCELSAAAECNGTCRGSCSGSCSATDAQGNCAGQCDGMCEGSCELAAMAQCNGTCHGECHASVTPPECEGVEVKCEAQCMGGCSGKCAGDFEPPSASADCEASAECNAQASAQAEASVECTPPSLEFDFGFAANVDASAQAAFTARLQQVRIRLAAALQAAARAQALVTGEVNGEVVFDPSPAANLVAELQGTIDVVLSGELDIPAGRLPCVVPAFEGAVEVLGEASADLQATAEGSVELFAFVGNPQG